MLPMASVSLCLDDEVQYRCAGYIQAEIERYAEALDVGDGDEEEEVLDSDGEPMSDGEQADDLNKKTRPGKGKRSFKEG
jgi:cohesin complex subunit SA-1/2